MATSSSRRSKGKVNYAEVDSDADMLSEEEGVERGTATRARVNENSDGEGFERIAATDAKKRSPSSKAKSKKIKYDVKMLLNLPFDLFAEICSHLGVKDAISLAKVNKALHALLVSRASRSIWAGIRKRDGFALLDGMTELKFASFRAAQCCDGCGAVRYVQRSTFLRVVLCKECRSGRTISSNKLKSQWPNLHPLAKSCVRFEEVNNTGAVRRDDVSARFLVEDLARANDELLEIEEEDEIAQVVRETEQRKVKSRLRAVSQSLETVEDPPIRHFEAHLAKKMTWVSTQQEASLSYFKSEDAFQVLAVAEKRTKSTAELLQRAADFDALSPELELLGWTEDDIELYYRDFVSHRSKRVPTLAPSAAPDQWWTYLENLNKRHEYFSWEQREQLDQRRSSLAPFFESLKASEAPCRQHVFPAFKDMIRFPEIAAFLDDKNSTPMTEPRWLALLPSTLEHIDQFCQDSRVEAIRIILSVRENRALSKYSKSSAQYSESAYPPSFFELAASYFPPSPSYGLPELVPYPQIAAVANGRGTLHFFAERRTTSTVQAMVRAAGLEESVATGTDLDNLGRRFTWDNDTDPTRRDVLHTWHELDGVATTIVSYFPQVDANGTTYLDEEGDGPGEVVESDAETDDVDATRVERDLDEGKEGNADAEETEDRDED
ncbi:hypothetical protein JCM11491_004247 [Sporobolomyces phaffii]